MLDPFTNRHVSHSPAINFKQLYPQSIFALFSMNMDPPPQFLFHIQSPPPLSGGGVAPSAVKEAYINGVYDGLNLRSLLTCGSFYPALDDRNLISMPMTEQLFTTHDAVLPTESLPFDFFSEPAMFSSHHSEKLPDLLSLETAVGPESKFPMDRRFADARTPPKQRRQRVVSEKTRRLQKLLPLEKKIDTASVLEETHKYIRFLEAQVSVLQLMPEVDCGGGSWSTATESGVDLGRLNRQELLQVMVNSPVVQKLLYSNGCCVYSVEQLALLKKNAPFHQTPYDSNH